MSKEDTLTPSDRDAIARVGKGAAVRRSLLGSILHTNLDDLLDALHSEVEDLDKPKQTSKPSEPPPSQLRLVPRTDKLDQAEENRLKEVSSFHIGSDAALDPIPDDDRLLISGSRK